LARHHIRLYQSRLAATKAAAHIPFQPLSLRGHTVTAEALGLIVAYTPQGCTNYFKAGGDE